jgi:hypothetical protein
MTQEMRRHHTLMSPRASDSNAMEEALAEEGGESALSMRVERKRRRRHAGRIRTTGSVLPPATLDHSTDEEMVEALS